MARTLLTGREVRTLEVELGCDVAAARAMLPPRLELEVREGWASVALLVFAMESMRVKGLPGPTLAYHEALWRVRARLDGAPVFFAVACDLDHPLVRLLGATLIKYPVRRARFTFDEQALRVSAAGAALRLQTRPAGDEVPAVHEPLPVLSVERGALFRIPWEETPTADRRGVALEVLDDSLATRTLGGPLRWPTLAVAMRGRRHHCGVANRV